MLGAAAFAVLATAVASAPVGLLRRKVETADGFAVAIYRYAPPGGGMSRPAVLLIPDLGLGREAFDLDGAGLARYLGARGRDTYVVELRGQGHASVAAPWHLTDWVAKDLPAALSAVAAVHPGPIDLVVHGFAGTLALAAVPVELSGRVGRVVALSTPVIPEVPNAVVRILLEDGGRFSRLGLDPPAFDLVFSRGGLFPSGRLGALRTALYDLSPPAAAELLGWMERGDLKLADGTSVRGRLAAYDRPTLLVLPLLDNFAHAEFASPLRELAPRAPVEVRLLSRWELDGEDYTHLSMLHGSAAQADVWAPALRFLDGEALPAIVAGQGAP